MKTLRKFYLALVAMMLCVGFTACEGEGGPINGDNIVGTWEWTEAYFWMTENGKTVYEVTFTPEDDETDIEKYWQFKENGTCTQYDENEEVYDEDYSTYEVEGNKLVVWEYYDESYTYTIKQLTSNKLVLEASESANSHARVTFKRVK